jgi:hypothetical protein
VNARAVFGSNVEVGGYINILESLFVSVIDMLDVFLEQHFLFMGVVAEHGFELFDAHFIDGLEGDYQNYQEQMS